MRIQPQKIEYRGYFSKSGIGLLTIARDSFAKFAINITVGYNCCTCRSVETDSIIGGQRVSIQKIFRGTRMKINARNVFVPSPLPFRSNLISRLEILFRSAIEFAPRCIVLVSVYFRMIACTWNSTTSPW